MSQSGDDGETKLGYAKSDLTRTVTAKKIQVRMSSGKIYGPYLKPEIIKFIQIKKIRGNEAILVEGESDWKPIGSDVDFYDAIQASIMGSKGAPAAPVRETLPAAAPTKNFIGDGDATAVRAGHTQVSAPQENLIQPPEASQRSFVEIKAQAAPVTENPPSENTFASRQMPELDSGSVLKKQKKPFLLLAVGVIVLMVVVGARFGQPRRGAADERASLAGSGLGFHSSLVFYRPLQVVFDDGEIKSPELPGTLQPSSGNWTLPLGFGAQFWLKELRELSQPAYASLQSSATYWAREAWALAWLGATVAGADREQAKVFLDAAQTIEKKLAEGKLLSENARALFAAKTFLVEGKWSEARAQLQPAIASSELARYLSETASWNDVWESGGAKSYEGNSNEYSESEMTLVARLRSALVAKDQKGVFEGLMNLAEEFPNESVLWFSGGQYNWKLRSDQIQIANKLFVTGLATLSYLPPSFQKHYWKEFRAFLSTFAREGIAAKADQNIELLAQGKVNDKAQEFWDLGQESLDVVGIVNDAGSRIQTSAPQTADVATLQVLSPTTSAGSLSLAKAAMHWLLEENWPHAREMLESALRSDKTNTLALTGLVWANAAEYRFEKAFELQEQLSALSKDNFELKRLTATIQFYGRETDNAIESFREYLKNAPADGLGHYQLAKAFEVAEKNVDCVRETESAQRTASGEVLLRAHLLNARCRIKANMGKKDVLESLKKMVQQYPNSGPVAIEYIDALLSIDQAVEAEQEGRAALERLSSAYPIYIKLGEIFEKRRDADRALAFYLRATRERKDSGEAWVKIGNVFMEQGKYRDAAQNFEAASRVQPSYPEVWLLAARAYREAKMNKEASQMYAKEIQERPAVVVSFLEAAEFSLKIGAPQDVLKLFESFKPEYRSDPQVMLRMAQTYLALSRLDEARTAAATVLTQDQKSAEANLILGFVFEKQGSYESSRQYFEAYLGLSKGGQQADEIRRKIDSPPFK